MQMAAALLHDTVEDCGGPPVLEQVRACFGDEVAAIVDGCSYLPASEEESWREQKQHYLEQLHGLPEDAALVALCDKLHNAMSVRADYERCRERLWERFRSGREGALWYYGAVRDLFAPRTDSPPARELGIVVAAIEEAAAQPRNPTATPVEQAVEEWRLKPSHAKETIVETVRRRAEDGGREEQIVMAYLLASGQITNPDLTRADEWLGRARAEHLREQIVSPE